MKMSSALKIPPALAALVATALTAVALTTAQAAPSPAESGAPSHSAVAAAPSAGPAAQPRIIGGGLATEPLSFLGYDYCGYSLIAPKWMITAAHCLQPYKFGIGTLDQKEGGERVEMARIIRHPKYVRNSKPKGYDVALIELTKPATSKPGVIAAGAGPVGQKTRIWGWGATDPAGQNDSKKLKVLDTSLIATADCKVSDPDVSLTLDLCLSNAGGTGACYGDSGGPMTKMVNGQMQIIGVTSRGPEKCGTSPSIYTNITMHAEWIKQVTRGEALFATGDTTQPGDGGSGPAPSQPAPTQPGPTQPAPTQPAPWPTQPAPTQPAPWPTQPAPTQPAPWPTQPAPTQPAPWPTQPAPTQPAPIPTQPTRPPAPTGQPGPTGQPTRPRPTWPGLPRPL